jgi:hypothetical protein
MGQTPWPRGVRGYSLTGAALATTCAKTLGFRSKRSNRPKQMGTILFGDASLAMVAPVALQDMTQVMTNVRGMNGCAMASDRG